MVRGVLAMARSLSSLHGNELVIPSSVQSLGSKPTFGTNFIMYLLWTAFCKPICFCRPRFVNALLWRFGFSLLGMSSISIYSKSLNALAKEQNSFCIGSLDIQSRQPPATVVEQRVPSAQSSPATDHSQFEERSLQEDGRAQEQAHRKKE